jgi:acetyl-CoA carboxylase biotin carboxyl carrier protein
MAHVIAAELVGTVLKVVVEQGQDVAAGDTIVLLESMKMEIPVLTEFAGVVQDVSVHEGENVQEGDVLAVVG